MERNQVEEMIRKMNAALVYWEVFFPAKIENRAMNIEDVVSIERAFREFCTIAHGLTEALEVEIDHLCGGDNDKRELH